MYEDLQQEWMPSVPKSIRVDNLLGKVFGIISPSKLMIRMFAEDRTEEETNYFESVSRYRVYHRIARKDEWKAIYRRYRLERRSGKTDVTYRKGIYGSFCYTESFKINEILRSMPGWEKTANELRFGYQRGFMKEG